MKKWLSNSFNKIRFVSIITCVLLSITLFFTVLALDFDEPGFIIIFVPFLMYTPIALITKDLETKQKKFVARRIPLLDIKYIQKHSPLELQKSIVNKALAQRSDSAYLFPYVFSPDEVVPPLGEDNAMIHIHCDFALNCEVPILGKGIAYIDTKNKFVSSYSRDYDFFLLHLNSSYQTYAVHFNGDDIVCYNTAKIHLNKSDFSKAVVGMVVAFTVNSNCIHSDSSLHNYSNTASNIFDFSVYKSMYQSSTLYLTKNFSKNNISDLSIFELEKLKKSLQ